MNAGRGHQAPRKAAHSLQKEVGQNIKDKKKTKELGTETHPEEGVIKNEKFPNSRKPSRQRVCGEFWNLRGQHNQEGKQTNKQKPQIMCPTRTPSGEVGQMLQSTSSKPELNREARAACLA